MKSDPEEPAKEEDDPKPESDEDKTPPATEAVAYTREQLKAKNLRQLRIILEEREIPIQCRGRRC